MSRTPPEWIGKTDDTSAPPRVRLRQFKRDGKKCCECGCDLSDGRGFETDHKVAIINGGENREANLHTLCKPCHKKKTAADVAIKAVTARKQKANYGIRPRNKWRRDDRFKKLVGGEVVERATGKQIWPRERRT